MLLISCFAFVLFACVYLFYLCLYLLFPFCPRCPVPGTSDAGIPSPRCPVPASSASGTSSLFSLPFHPRCPVPASSASGVSSLFITFPSAVSCAREFRERGLLSVYYLSISGVLCPRVPRAGSPLCLLPFHPRCPVPASSASGGLYYVGFFSPVHIRSAIALSARNRYRSVS